MKDRILNELVPSSRRECLYFAVGTYYPVLFTIFDLSNSSIFEVGCTSHLRGLIWKMDLNRSIWAMQITGSMHSVILSPAWLVHALKGDLLLGKYFRFFLNSSLDVPCAGGRSLCLRVGKAKHN